jgi:hypothetical protein
VEPGLKIWPAVGLVMDTIGVPEPPPPVEVGEGLGDVGRPAFSGQLN